MRILVLTTALAHLFKELKIDYKDPLIDIPKELSNLLSFSDLHFLRSLNNELLKEVADIEPIYRDLINDRLQEGTFLDLKMIKDILPVSNSVLVNENCDLIDNGSSVIVVLTNKKLHSCLDNKNIFYELIIDHLIKVKDLNHALDSSFLKTYLRNNQWQENKRN